MARTDERSVLPPSPDAPVLSAERRAVEIAWKAMQAIRRESRGVDPAQVHNIRQIAFQAQVDIMALVPDAGEPT